MRLTNKWILLVGLLSWLPSCGKKGRSIYSSEKTQELHWAEGAQIGLSYSTSVPSEYKDGLQEAVKKQNEILLRTQIYLKNGSVSMNQFNVEDENTFNGDGINSIYFVNQSLYNKDTQSSADALTLVRSQDGEIYECDIIFNRKVIESQSNPTSSLEALALHEIGHAIGLAHSQDPSSIMYAEINTEDLRSTFYNTSKYQYSN
jgi:hypothetical protein